MQSRVTEATSGGASAAGLLSLPQPARTIVMRKVRIVEMFCYGGHYGATQLHFIVSQCGLAESLQSLLLSHSSPAALLMWSSPHVGALQLALPALLPLQSGVSRSPLSQSSCAELVLVLR